MSYSAEISRSRPGCFLFLVDQSGSMRDHISGNPVDGQKSKAAADALNRSLQAITIRCSQGEEVRDYFDIGVIGYTTDGIGFDIIESELAGTTPEQPFIPISEVSETAKLTTKDVKENDGAGGMVTAQRQFPVWLEPKAEYGTPMREVFQTALLSIQKWTSEHPESFPPIIIHISDGEGDEDPLPVAQQIMALQTKDGNPLVFNIHLSSKAGNPVRFPATEDILPDSHAVSLFNMSSVLPPQAAQAAKSLDIDIPENARGYVFNSDMNSLVQFLEIGTRAAGLR